jgi:hypothetical protein
LAEEMKLRVVSSISIGMWRIGSFSASTVATTRRRPASLKMETTERQVSLDIECSPWFSQQSSQQSSQRCEAQTTSSNLGPKMLPHARLCRHFSTLIAFCPARKYFLPRMRGVPVDHQPTPHFLQDQGPKAR